jgi:heat shock protein HslJ
MAVEIGIPMRLINSSIVLLPLLLGACTLTPGHSAQLLQGTSWQLLTIQSMDDTQGMAKISSPQRYTVSFGADGLAAFRIDCNRATSTWQAIPVAGDSGSLTFGPVAMTRMMCPPGSLNQKVMRDLSYVRSYLFKGDKLFMSLMADGGIYEWLPYSPADKKPEELFD